MVQSLIVICEHVHGESFIHVLYVPYMTDSTGQAGRQVLVAFTIVLIFLVLGGWHGNIGRGDCAWYQTTLR